MTKYGMDTTTLPLLALRGLTVFPGMSLHFDVGREKSVRALEDAMTGDQQIFLVTQKNMRDDDPTLSELYNTGTVARVKQTMKLPGGNLRAMVEGVYRAKTETCTEETPYFHVTVKKLLDAPMRASEDKIGAMLRLVKELFETYCEVAPKLGQDVELYVEMAEDPATLADYITQNIMLKYQERQTMLEQRNPYKRLELMSQILMHEIDILTVESEIHRKTREAMDKNQKDYFIREQIKVMQSELGEREDPISEAEEYKTKICALSLSKDSENKLIKEASRLAHMIPSSPEGAVIRTYLDTCLELPWKKRSETRIDLDAARKILDADHFGLKKVKERILEYLAVCKLTGNVKSQIICLVGPPGVGKTSIGQSLAKAMNRKTARVSLGGSRDEADIRGHRKTYIGAMPGRIITALRQAGTKNPVILLDEIDKLGSDFRGDPSSALLEVLDGEQNHAFRDHYIEIPFDLSEVLFVMTANTTDTIPRPLLDRMELIEVPGYTDEEKLHIAKEHLMPKILRQHGLKKSQLRINDDVYRAIIDGYTREAGVRQLERSLAALCRKAAMEIADGANKSVAVTSDKLHDMLGVARCRHRVTAKNDEVGVANGLAWTAAGGELLPVEVNVVDGTGKLELTGNLGTVMKESAMAAVSCVRSRAKALGIDGDFYKTKDMHFHFPEGAIPKDGPSAGITMALALVSVLTNTPVRGSVAMTGEITLRGRVLAIGGLKEKTMAAMRDGIKTVIIPAENIDDIEEIDQDVRAALRFVPAATLDAVLSSALCARSDVETSEHQRKVTSADNNADITGNAAKDAGHTSSDSAYL